MKRSKLVIISILGLILLVSPNLVLDVCFDSFDKYRFVEEWYKLLIQLVLTLFITGYCLRNFALYRDSVRIVSFLLGQSDKINSISKAIEIADDKEFFIAIEHFLIEYQLSVLDCVSFGGTRLCNEHLITNIMYILKRKETFKLSEQESIVHSIKDDCKDYQAKINLYLQFHKDDQFGLLFGKKRRRFRQSA